MVKLGEIKNVEFEFNQALYPMSKQELQEIVKVCADNDYPFSMQVSAEPLVLETAIGNKKVELPLRNVVFIFHEDVDAILEKVEEMI